MPDPVLLALGAAIRQKRLQLGWSQEELADRTGLHRTYIGGIERGERNVAVKNIQAIAEALGVPASTLLEKLPQRTETAGRR